MNRNEQFLSLIGLCLRGRNLEVGEEPVEAVARARDARVLLLASDAADNTARTPCSGREPSSASRSASKAASS